MSNEISVADVLEKHCPSMNNLYLDNQGRAFRDRVVNAMNEYAKLKTAQLEADKAELVRGLKDITRQFERVGRLYSLDQKAISAANALIQKHAAK